MKKGFNKKTYLHVPLWKELRPSVFNYSDPQKVERRNKKIVCFLFSVPQLFYKHGNLIFIEELSYDNASFTDGGNIYSV